MSRPLYLFRKPAASLLFVGLGCRSIGSSGRNSGLISLGEGSSDVLWMLQPLVLPWRPWCIFSAQPCSASCSARPLDDVLGVGDELGLDDRSRVAAAVLFLGRDGRMECGDGSASPLASWRRARRSALRPSNWSLLAI